MFTISPSVCSSQVSRRVVLRVGVAAASLVVLAACGSDGGAAEPVTTGAGADVASEARFTVVAADSPIANLVAQVAGDGVEVRSVVPIGVNGHTYEPVPEDARTLAEADMYIENGMDLNNVVTDFALSNSPEGTPHHELSDVIPPGEVIATDSAEEIAEHGHAHSYNAHFWPDLRYAKMYVERISQILSEYDAANAAGYAERATAVTAQLQQMDAAIVAALATVPAENRKMVVYHDSWSYFGRRYGIPVIGAIQPTDFSEPSAAELRATIEEVRAAGVPAFFGSEVFPSDVLEVIEAESGATYVADLSDDRLPGEPGSPEHSYQGMMLANTRTIVQALGGDSAALDAIVLTAS